MKFREYLKENFKPIGQPVGGVKDPDWLPVDKDYEKYLCKKCGYPLLGYGKVIPNNDFVNTQDGTFLYCLNCQHKNNLGNFRGYIDEKGKVNKQYFNRTTPVEIDYMEED